MKLNLGCGKDIREGYMNIDINVYEPSVTKGDITNLDFIEKDSVDEIFMRDVLEHFIFDDSLLVLGECSRVLKSGGKITIRTINIDKQIEAYTSGRWNLREFNFMVFAGMNWSDSVSKKEDFHKCAYNHELLKEELKKVGIKIDKVEIDEIKNLSGGCNLNFTIEGTKE
jgi:predicted SAM-dependent methyltransferase